MNPNITVEFNPYDMMDNERMADIVFFRYEDPDAEIEWRSICDIDAWLQAHDIEYTVDMHFTARTYMRVECPEARTLIKLAFNEWIPPVTFDPDAETMSMANPCCEITI